MFSVIILNIISLVCTWNEIGKSANNNVQNIHFYCYNLILPVLHFVNWHLLVAYSISQFQNTASGFNVPNLSIVKIAKIKYIKPKNSEDEQCKKVGTFFWKKKNICFFKKNLNFFFFKTKTNIGIFQTFW